MYGNTYIHTYIHNHAHTKSGHSPVRIEMIVNNYGIFPFFAGTFAHFVPPDRHFCGEILSVLVGCFVSCPVRELQPACNNGFCMYVCVYVCLYCGCLVFQFLSCARAAACIHACFCVYVFVCVCVCVYVYLQRDDFLVNAWCFSSCPERELQLNRVHTDMLLCGPCVLCTCDVSMYVHFACNNHSRTCKHACGYDMCKLSPNTVICTSTYIRPSICMNIYMHETTSRPFFYLHRMRSPCFLIFYIWSAFHSHESVRDRSMDVGVIECRGRA
jgi:hypothetical protein